MFLSDFFSLLTLIFSAVSILAMLRYFGKEGLFIYSIIVVIGANIQVLRVAQYSFFSSPIPLGTVLFSTMFAVDNILNEHFGKETAKKCVYLGFVGYLAFSVMMLLADWHPFVTETSCANFPDAIHIIFSPSIVFFISSISAYLVGQLCDVYVYSYFKEKFLEKNISFRSAVTMIISTFVDNFVFSILAWKILSSIFIPWEEILKSYILNTSIFRIFLVLLCVPIVHFSKHFLPKKAS